MLAKLRLLFAATLLAAANFVYAVEVPRPAYTPTPPAVNSGSIVQIVFSLLLVLAAILLVAWLLKRMNVAQHGTANMLKVLGGVAIGQRERVVLLEVNDTWLVIGVGPGQIRTLHTLPKSTLEMHNTSTEPSKDFSVWLKKFTEKRNAA